MRYLLAGILTLRIVTWADCAHGEVDPLVLAPGISSYTLAPYLEWYEDPSGSLTIEDVSEPEMAEEFRAVGPKNPNFGMTSSAVWLRFALTTSGPTGDVGRLVAGDEWLFDVGWAALGEVRLFVPEGGPGTWKILETGAFFPPKPDEDPLTKFRVLRLPLPSGEEKWIYYVRVRSEAAMLLPVTLWTYDAYRQHLETLTLGYGVFYGLIAAIILMNLIAYPWVRDASLLWYASVLFFLSLYFLEFNLIRTRFFPIQSVAIVQRMAHFFLASALALMGAFYRSFLGADPGSRLFGKVSAAYIALAVPGVILTFLPFVSPQFMKHYDLIVGSGALVLVVGFGIASLRSGYHPAQVLSIAWIVFGGFALKHTLTLWGYLPVTQWSYHSLQIGVAAISVVFSYAIWYRLKIIREEREQHIRESEARYRLLAENITDVIWTMDTLGRFTYVSPSVQRLEGYTVEEAKNRRLEDYMPPRSVELARRVLAEEVSRSPKRPGERSRQRVLELEQFRKDGSSMWAEVTGSFVLDSEGHPKEIVGVTRDITERKRQEDERRHLEAQIQNAQKLESLGVLAGGIAHDFNNLLTSVLGNASLLLSTLSPESDEREMVEEIEHAGQRAAELARQMLAYSGRGSFLVEPLNLNDLVEEMPALLKASLSKKATLRLALADPLPFIEGDMTQIRQVVMNLIINASEALGEAEGAITVSTEATFVERGALSRVHWGAELSEGKYVYLEVTDTGCGMDEHTQARIFEPFFTTKFTGRGLGLSATLGIIRSHSGVIEIRSEPNRGSTFRVLFPVSQNEAPRSNEKETEESASWQGSGAVLLVDDEDGVRDVAASIVKQMGLRVFAARDGQEGVDVYREHAGEISVVLLDLTMPRLSGDQVFEELKRIRPDVRVILSTGYSEEDARTLFGGRGLAGFIFKPYRRNDLQNKLRQVLSGIVHP